jgi:hypothetical protein
MARSARALLIVSLAVTGPLPASAKEPGFAVPAGQRQLFLDGHGVAEVHNLKKTMHPPAKKGAVLRPTPPYEQTLQIRCAPAWVPGQKRFKLWMITSPAAPGGSVMTYAESADGLHWTKPNLGSAEVNGTRVNNRVGVDPKLRWPANAMENVLYDPDDPDPSRRYKALGDANGREPLVSADGIAWKRLDVPKIPSQDESNLSYDPQSHTFLATVKHRGPHGRSVFLSTSKDFAHWTKPELIFHADELDQTLGRENIQRRFADPTLQHPVYNNPVNYNVDVYNMGVFRYEGLYIGLPALYHACGNLPTVNTDGFHLVQLTCSRDLHKWERLGDRRPFIGPSPQGAGAYDLTQILPPSSPVVRGDELWFYYTGIKYRHVPEGADRDVGAICLAVLRRDGFLSLDAGEEEGWVLTRPFVLPRGSLHLNVDAGKGRAVVQVCDDGGKPLPGFEKSQPIIGDRLDGLVQWPQGKFEALAGKTVCLRINFNHAQLYAYWIQ